MCLTNRADEVNSVKDDVIVGYKVLSLYQKDGKTVALTAPCFGTEYKPGEIVSDATVKTFNDYDIVENGIHVYRTRENAENSWMYVMNVRVIVEVTGKREDLMAANKNQLVFMKVHLTEEEYRKHVPLQ